MAFNGNQAVLPALSNTRSLSLLTSWILPVMKTDVMAKDITAVSLNKLRQRPELQPTLYTTFTDDTQPQFDVDPS